MASFPGDCRLIRCDVGQVAPIDVLPNDVLLAIFDFYVFKYQDLVLLAFGGYDTKRKIESWQSLAHVCRRWRGLVLGSPRRLNLQLFCIPGTRKREALDIWPALPLLIQGGVTETSVNNVIAELEYSDRICQINLNCHTTSQIEKLWTAMEAPFPKLAVLSMSFGGSLYVPVLPDSFLGGSAPRLRYLALTSIPFPGLPKLLLSATHLVNLWLINIPHSGYISPETMANCLSMLTSLNTLQLEFESPQSGPDLKSRCPFRRTRSVLHTLTTFWFKGVNEYLEDLVARIDAPRIHHLSITFFSDIEFDTPELVRFMIRSSTLKAPNEAHVVFDSHITWVNFQSQAPNLKYFEIKVSCREPDWQLSSLAQICTLSLSLLSTTENLLIYEPVDSQVCWKDGIKNIEWLELLLPFTAVKNLYLSKQFAPRIAPALQEITGDRTTEVLPTLQNLYLEGLQPSEFVQGIGQFISARQLINCPVSVSIWERYPEERPLEVD